MGRHQQKDLEAGGPGQGILVTRKRAWKGLDGSVVEKRPRADTGTAPAGDLSRPEPAGQVVSPPVSDEGRCNYAYQVGRGNENDSATCIDAVEASSTASQPFALPYFPHPQLDNYLPLNLSSPRIQISPTNGHLDNHPAFQPDTASSFNMPYTTALDYNWLFNIGAATASGFDLLGSGRGFQDQVPLPGHEVGDRVQNHDVAAHRHVQDLIPPSQSSTVWRSLGEAGLPRHFHREASFAPGTSLHWTDPETRTRSQADVTREASANTVCGTSFQRTEESDEPMGTREPRGRYHKGLRPQLWDDRRPLKLERPLSMLQKPHLLPQIDEDTRERLLHVVETANPQIPDQGPNCVIRNHPLLSLASLQSWLDRFFTEFNTAYPLIHTPTFDPSGAETLLLLSILLLGATYSEKGAHQVAVCIHDVIRPSIFAHAGFSPSPELWTLQTILLVECFGKSRAGQRQHDMSHLFHGLLINLIRRSDCQSIKPTPPPPSEDADAASMDKAWRGWAESEQRKRLALLCFMWDTQHAVLFCQSLCMSAFELRCAMPCAQSVWESPDAARWAVARRSLSSAAEPMFLPTLKSYLTTGATPEARNDQTAMSLVIVLHGIMSIAWDMQRRDQTSLGVSSMLGVPSWKDILSQAYDRWEAGFDDYCRDAASGPDDETRTEWFAFRASYRAIYHAAQALLHMDFLDVQIYAGARHILGRPVQQQDYIRSSKVVKRWAANHRELTAIAAWHAATMLCDVVTDKSRSQKRPTGTDLVAAVTDTNLFHVPWCLYLATLTCWAFHHARPNRKGREGGIRERYGDHETSAADDSDAGDEIVWDAQKEMEALVKGMAGAGNVHATLKDLLAGQGRKRTHGLVWVVADLLSHVRWGIVHAGVVVLRGLVPTRLINQYETR